MDEPLLMPNRKRNSTKNSLLAADTPAMEAVLKELIIKVSIRLSDEDMMFCSAIGRAMAKRFL